MPGVTTGATFVSEDWTGRELGSERFESCVLDEVELADLVTRGTAFEGCEFLRCGFGGSQHTASRFSNCVFRDCSFFSAEFVDCKLTGSRFENCGLRPLVVTGGLWNLVSLRDADLRNATLTGVDLSETDLGGSRLGGAVLRDSVLREATLTGSRLEGADLRGCNLSGATLENVSWRKVRVDLAGAGRIAESLGARVD